MSFIKNYRLKKKETLNRHIKGLQIPIPVEDLESMLFNCSMLNDEPGRMWVNWDETERFTEYTKRILSPYNLKWSMDSKRIMYPDEDEDGFDNGRY